MYLYMNNIVRFGTQYGGFYYPEHLPKLNENSIIYCVCAGEDITHDVILSFKKFFFKKLIIKINGITLKIKLPSISSSPKKLEAL